MAAVDKESSVRGILVAEEFHDRLLHATRTVSNVQLRKYGFEFSFSVLSSLELHQPLFTG